MRTVDDNPKNLADNRRRAPRRALNQRIGLLVAGEYTAAAVALELGEGGMLLQSPLPLEKGQHVVVTFRIRGVLQGVVRASVVYVRPPETLADKEKYGLQFENLDFDVKRKIRNFVASGAKQAAVSAVRSLKNPAA